MTSFQDDRFTIKIENGIIFIEWNKEKYSYEDVDFGIKKRIEIANNESYPLLSDLKNAKIGSREARQRLSEKDAGIGVTAVAIIVKSKAQKVIYDFFNTIYRAPAPAKLFTNKEEAIIWLSRFKKK